MTSFRLPPVYPIVDVRDPSRAECDRAIQLAAVLADARATMIQLRAKPLDAGMLTRLATDLVSKLAGKGCAVVVNDRADVALIAGAAGVHLGDQDVPVAAARRSGSADMLIGFSTHDAGDLESESARSADYLGFGPVFESPTKPGARVPRGHRALARVCAATRMPVVAIGGVTLETAPMLWDAGAASVAVISEFERSADPAALLRAYLDAARR